MMATPTLELDRLTIAFRRRGRWLEAVRDLSLTIAPGEAFGLVGESGSGKSTAAMAALRYLPRNGRISKGRVLFEGTDLAGIDERQLRKLRGNRIAAVYQNPGAALNPVLHVGRQVAEVFAQHRNLDGKAAHAASIAVLEKVRIPDPDRVMTAYPHELSGGMQQRVVIAMALATDPSLLVLDEPTTALDVSVQGEVLRLFEALRAELSASILFISHNLAVVRQIADRVGVLYAGELVEEGRSDEVFGQPRHPYTRALVGCVPRFGFDKHEGRLLAIEGTPPDIAQRVTGCSFSPRCPVARPDCANHHPTLAADSIGRLVRCPYTGDAEQMAEPRTVPPSPPPGEQLLDCRDVHRSFGRAAILHGIDLDVRRGETVGLVGESGSGKSTFAKVVAGLIAPDQGAIVLDGAALAGSAARRPMTVRRAIQMVFQSPDTTLNPSHRIGGILGRAIRLLGSGGDSKNRITELLTAVRLPETAAAANPNRLSGGQRQRVAIARAFAGDPNLVILDEPTSALDVSVQAAVLDLLLDLQREKRVAYLFITHDLAVVRYLADRIAVLYKGQLVEFGPAAEVFGNPSHPYTRSLLAAMPDASPPDDDDLSPPGIGVGASAADPEAKGSRGLSSLSVAAETDASGCPYRTNCALAAEDCSVVPAWRTLRPGHLLRCWRVSTPATA